MGKILDRLFHRRVQAKKKPRHQKRTLLQHKELEEKLDKWVAEKGYRYPDATVGEAADRIEVDRYHLQRYFTEVRGEDFRTWRTRLRIQEARQKLLDEPDTPTSTIARQVGFSDRSNFARQFTRLTGETPLAYRKKRLAPNTGPASADKTRQQA